MLCLTESSGFDLPQGWAAQANRLLPKPDGDHAFTRKTDNGMQVTISFSSQNMNDLFLT